MPWDDLQNSFREPDNTYRPAPFWFWNSKLEPAEIERQIQLMHEAGLGGFFMHARFGLETEYMGPEWMECIRHAVRTAHRYGMAAWLYDEYPFPSGVGGLEVTRNPEHCSKFIDLVEVQETGPGMLALPLPEGEVLEAYAIPVGRLEHLAVESQVLTSASDGVLEWEIPDGDWHIMAFVKRTLQDPRGNVFGPDYLNPSTTHAFLRVLDAYVTDPELREHLGTTIPGIFTDEPCILTWHQNHTNYPVHHDARLAAWSDDMPERLRRRGYDWHQVLLAIFYDCGPRSEELRCAYRQAAADSYIESFFVPYREWCQKHRLKLTGHLLLEEGLYTNTIFQGNFIADLSHFDIPGSDHLGNGCEAEYGGWGNLPLMSTNVQGQKLVSSISHLYGKEATLSESFGIGGWDLRLADMKRIVDWQYRLGINFLCPHAFYYSIEGFRKHDSPPSQFFQASYWSYYRYFADYVGRLSVMMRAGKHVAQAALLYPQDAFWRAFKAGKEDTVDRRLADQFDFFASELLRCHVDYNMVPDFLINPQTIHGGRLYQADESYPVVIVPSISKLSDELRETLTRMYQQGGKLLLAEPVSPDLRTHLLDVSSPQGKWVSLASLRREELEEAIDTLLVRNIRADTPEVTFLQRELDGKQIYFCASDSSKHLDAQIRIRGTGRLEEWDLETGGIRTVPSEQTSDGTTQVMWHFAPHASTLLVLDPERAPESCMPDRETQHHSHRVLSDSWEFACHSPNVLPLEDWQLHLTAQGDWIHYDYTSTFEATVVPAAIELMLDDVESRTSFMAGMFFKIFVNKQEVLQQDAGFHIDPKWKTYSIADKLHVGQNEVHLRFTNQSWAGEPKGMTIPPKLLGDFSLRKGAEEEWTITESKCHLRSGTSWTEQGYPFYSGSATYTQILEISAEDLTADEIWIDVPEVADMVEFSVNENPVGVRPWPPYRCEIKAYLQPGTNRLSLKVTNSMQNFIEGKPKPSGLLGDVYLITSPS